MYGVDVFFGVIQSFFVGSRVCVILECEVNARFPVKVGLIQGFHMFHEKFNLDMDGVVK